MTDSPDPPPKNEPTEELGSQNEPIDERVWQLEHRLKDALKRIDELENPDPIPDPKIWKDRKFIAGVLALPSLILGGWILTGIDKYVFSSKFFQPMPFIHTLLGTEEAVKAYVSPSDINRGDIRDEIVALIGDTYVTVEELSEMKLVSSEDLKQKKFLNRQSLKQAAEEGEIDERIRGIGGRRQNFNDFFVQNLGLNPNAAQKVECENVPRGEEFLEFKDQDERNCFLVSESFVFSNEFTILRPKDVKAIQFEVFVVPLRATSVDEGGINGEALNIPPDARKSFFDLRVNAQPTEMKVSGAELEFAQGIDALKYEATFELPEPMQDRSYDILTVSLNLIEYDSVFGSQRRDKSFTVFVVPSFTNI